MEQREVVPLFCQIKAWALPQILSKLIQDRVYLELNQGHRYRLEPSVKNHLQ